MLPGDTSQTVIDVLERTRDKRPREGVVYGIDGDRLDIRLADSTSVVRHVEATGSLDGVKVGDRVQITWGATGRPTAVLVGSQAQSYVPRQRSSVTVDNLTIEHSPSGIRVKNGGISREHLSFDIASGYIDPFTEAGWKVNPSGVIYHNAAQIFPDGQISLGAGDNVIKLSAYGTEDDPNSPELDTAYRLWVGKAEPWAAPFTIDKDGYVRATRGLIGGWELAKSEFVSDDGNSVLHAGARPFLALGGFREYGQGGFWVGKDTDYIYKMSIGDTGNGQLLYDGSSLSLQDVDIKMYYGTNMTLWIQSDGDMAIGSDIDTAAGTSMRIFSNAQTWDSESFGAGDLLIGDHSGAHMFWDQGEGQLQFRDGSQTGIPVTVYIDTDGSLQFGDSRGRLDQQGLTIASSTVGGAEYYWNSVNWVDSLSTNNLAGRISAAAQGTYPNTTGYLWIRAIAGNDSNYGVVSIGADLSTTTTNAQTAWLNWSGSAGGMLEVTSWWDTYNTVNSAGNVQYMVWMDPPYDPTDVGFGHRTVWNISGGSYGLETAAAMDVVWTGQNTGAEMESAIKFFVLPDAGLTEMVRIGPMAAEDAYALVVNPQSHSEGNLLVYGSTSSPRLLYSDAGSNFMGTEASYWDWKEIGAPGTPASGYSRLYLKTDGLLYLKTDAGVEYDLTGGAPAASTFTDEGDYSWTTDRITIGADEDYYPTGTNSKLKLLITDGYSWTPVRDELETYAYIKDDITISNISGGGLTFLSHTSSHAGVYWDWGDTSFTYGKIEMFGPDSTGREMMMEISAGGSGYLFDLYNGVIKPLSSPGNFTFDFPYDGFMRINSSHYDVDFYMYDDSTANAYLFYVDNGDRTFAIGDWSNGVSLVVYGNNNTIIETDPAYGSIIISGYIAAATPSSNKGALYATNATNAALMWKDASGTAYRLQNEWVESGGYLTQNTGADIVSVQNWLRLQETTAPATGLPATGWGALYASSDGKVYYKNDGGTTYDLTSGVGGGADILEVQVFS